MTIIAEAGVNHNGKLSVAKKLVDIAFESGADIVKFQTFDAETLVTRNAPKADYQKLNARANESQFEMLSKLQLSSKDHEELISHCKIKGIQFMSTGFDIVSVDLLNNFGQEIFKIPSGEITNLPLLRHIAKLQKEVLLSTGNSDITEIKNALNILERGGCEREKITVLHCTSAYPAPIQDVNLCAMLTIQEKFGLKVGYSDHTEGIEVSLAAVAMGASVIEKHFTLDKSSPGPDHRTSLDPSELALLVKSIRNLEQAFGDGIKRPMPSELANKKIVRQSIVAKAQIRKGAIFSVNNVTTKRAGGGLSPMEWDRVIGQPANREYFEDESIEI